MKALKSALMVAGVGALFAVLSAAPASADVTTVEWNPTAVGLTGTTLTANDFAVGDYAVISNIPSVTDVQETAYLPIIGASVSPALPSALPGFQLYFKVEATSSLATGKFTSFTYQLYGVSSNHGLCSGSSNGSFSCPAADTKVLLANGSLSSTGANLVGFAGTPGLVGFSAFADADATLVPVAAEDAFFENPNAAAYADLLLESAFTNTSGDMSEICENSTNTGTVNCASASANRNDLISVTIHNSGGGTVDVMGVPEPLTLSLFGAGLAGAAGLRRRKSKKA